MWKEAKRAAAFFEELKALEVGPDLAIGDETVAEWLAWVETTIKLADPLGHGVEATFTDNNSKHARSCRD
jgi:hypothetical protein